MGGLVDVCTISGWVDRGGHGGWNELRTSDSVETTPASFSTSATVSACTLAALSNHAVEPVPVETMAPEQRTVSRSSVSMPMSKMEGREGSASEKKTCFWGGEERAFGCK